MVSPRASISTNCSMRRARVSVLLGTSDPIKDGVPIRAGERLKHCLSPRIGGQGIREVIWNFYAGLPGVGDIPPTILLCLSNLVFA